MMSEQDMDILTETRNDIESCDESEKKSIMMSRQEMENINSGDESDHDLISTEMLEDIRDGSHTHPNVNIRETRYKIRYRIRQRQSEWKGALKATQSIRKVLQKVFSTVVKEISQALTPLGESSSEVSHFIPEPRKFVGVKKNSESIKETLAKGNSQGDKEFNQQSNLHD